MESAFYPIIGQMERAAGLAHDDDLNAKLDKLDALGCLKHAMNDAPVGLGAIMRASTNQASLIKHLKDVRPKLNVVADNAELWCLFD